MKSKSAFTLIELLAVIVILSIVLSIAVVSVSGIIENSKKESFKSSLSNAARKIKYNVAQGKEISGNLEDLDLQNNKLTGFYNYNYTNGQVTFGENTRSESSGICLNINTNLVDLSSEDIIKCTSLSKGLVGYWNFDGNASDNTLFNNNGTVNGATLTTDRFNSSNKAYNFDGITSYIEVPHNAVLNPADMTVSIWIKPTAWTDPVATSLLSKRSTISNGWTVLFIGTGTSGQINWDLDSGTSQDRWNTGYFPPVGQWTLLTLVRNSTKRYLYVNGILYSQQNTPGYADQTPIELYIGKNRVDPNSQKYNGKMDDIRIYNRALLESAILELYSIS